MMYAVSDLWRQVALDFTWAQLVLTPVALIIAVLVVKEWHPHVDALLKKYWKATAWFSLGIVVHFSTQMFDILYWFAYWGSAFIFGDEAESTKFLYLNGPIANVPFRILGTIIGGYCHIKASRVNKEMGMNDIHMKMFYALCAGIFVISAAKWFF